MAMLNIFKIFSKKKDAKPAEGGIKSRAQKLINLLGNYSKMDKQQKVNAGIELMKLSQSVYREELSEWQNARQTAIRSVHPLPYQLIEIYRRTMLDPHLSAAIRNRQSRVLNKGFEIKEPDGTLNEEKTALLDKAWFRKYLKFELDTIFWGYGLAWFGDEENKKEGEFVDFTVVPRQNIVPATRSVVEYRGLHDGLKFDSEEMRDWHIFSCLPDEWTEEHLGILNKAAPIKILKNHSLASWDGFEERHGVPMVVYMANMLGDEEARKNVFDWLVNLTTDNVAVLPSLGGDLKLIEPSNTDVYQIFNEKIERCNKELSKLVEGATSTLDQGQKFQVSEVHERTSGNITNDDMRHLKYRVENALIPFLQMHGYQFTGEESFDFKSEETLSKKEKLDYLVKLSQQGYRFEAEQIQELIGLEVSSEPLRQIGRVQAKKPSHSPLAQVVGEEWRNKVVALYADACKKCTESNSIVNEGEDDINASDFKRIWDRLSKNIHDGDEIIVDEELWQETKNWLERAILEGFTLSDNEPSEVMIAFLERDVAIFSAFKTYQELRVATDLLVNDEGELRTFNEFRKEVSILSETFDVNYLKAEYVNAITSAQSASNWERFEEDADTFDLQYQTAGDERVRKEHERLDGITRPVDDTVWDSIMPPNGWRCRCDVVQVESGETPLTPPDKAQREADRAHRNDIFKFNPGKEKQAFPDQHPYYEVRSAEDLRDIQDFIDDNV